MSFVVNIGKIDDPENKIVKTPITFSVSGGKASVKASSYNWNFKLEGTLKDQCDIDSPVIAIKIGEKEDIKVPNLTRCNYMYIPNFNRYYFITDGVIVRNTFYEIHGEIDPLTSFAEEILNNKAFVERSGKDSMKSMYLTDNEWVVASNSRFAVEQMKPVTDDGYVTFKSSGVPEYILMTAGPSGVA